MSTPAIPSTAAVVGLGYVGLPLAIALSEHFVVVGYDIDHDRVAELNLGKDRTGEVALGELGHRSDLTFSNNPADLDACDAYFIAVPTPINGERLPDLAPLVSATELVAGRLKKGDLVVYESTVYPGATEEVCVPILERISGLSLNRDFYVGYSPERINPGDRHRTIRDIVKITSGSNTEAAEMVDSIYRKFVHAGTYRAPSIRVAEAAKAVENTQRDINIAFANELAIIFQKLGLDTNEVLEAAGTKWNFMPVRPGLVGGHCIGVDPYYLIHKAKSVGAEPRLIRAAREINEGMADFVVSRFTEITERMGRRMSELDVLILGFAFKENCADIRNSRVAEIVGSLRSRCKSVTVHDPIADPVQIEAEHGFDLSHPGPEQRFDAIVLAVAHDVFASSDELIRAWLAPGAWILDVKGVLPKRPDVHRLST